MCVSSNITTKVQGQSLDICKILSNKIGYLSPISEVI